MNEREQTLKRLIAIEDELVKLRKQRNYELFNLDENNIPRLRAYSQLISENKQAISLVEQNVSDVESSVTLLSQFTSFDNVVVVEASDDKTDWDKSKVYYDSNADVYWYHNGTQWTMTDSPITAGLDTSIAQIQAKTAENEAEIALVAKSVTQNTEDIVGLETLTGQIDGEIKTVKTNLAEVTAKADENETAISLVAKSVTDIESDIAGLESADKTLNESIAAIELKADDNAANIALVAKNVATNASDIVGLQETTGNIDNELTTVKTNLATVETKADDAAASAEMAAQSVTELEDEVTGQIETLSESVASVKTTADGNKSDITVLTKSVSDNQTSIAAVKTTADNASSSVSAIVTNIGSNGTVTAASIVAKINSAGSAVQISADHISLKGKTIALTTDSINIESTYFDVTTAGAVTCSSIAVSGTNSVIDITGTSSSTGKVYARYSGNSSLYSQLTPAGLAAYDSYFWSMLGSSLLQITDNQYSYSRNAYFRPNLLIQTNGQTYPLIQMSTQDPPWQEQVVIGGAFICVGGTKSRAEQTSDYGNRLLYAFETPTPLYSDFGRGTVAEDGLCYVYHDPIFYECIDTEYDYYVFIQPETSGDFTVVERYNDHFVVSGMPNARFAYMLVAPQKGYSATRTEELIVPETDPPQTPDPENAVYDTVGDTIMNEYESQLG